MRARALSGVLTTAGTALMLAGCGGDNITGTTSPGGMQPSSSVQRVQDHNQADISFAQEMIPHHAQAIQMAQPAAERARSQQVRDLAGRIEQAQSPEIQTMTSWLQAWNAQVPTTGKDHGGGMGTDGMDPQRMQQFERATGVQFDRLFLQMMIKHHGDAVTMARGELANGQNSEAKQLAQQIIDAQQAEIDEMKALLPQG